MSEELRSLKKRKVVRSEGPGRGRDYLLTGVGEDLAEEEDEGASHRDIWERMFMAKGAVVQRPWGRRKMDD